MFENKERKKKSNIMTWMLKKKGKLRLGIIIMLLHPIYLHIVFAPFQHRRCTPAHAPPAIGLDQWLTAKLIKRTFPANWRFIRSVKILAAAQTIRQGFPFHLSLCPCKFIWLGQLSPALVHFANDGLWGCEVIIMGLCSVSSSRYNSDSYQNARQSKGRRPR